MFSQSALRLSLPMFLFCATATAQSTTVYETVPPGYKGQAGNYYSKLLGAYANGRMQFVNDAVIDQGRKLISRISFRRDKGRFYHHRNGMGRTWTRVDVWMGEGTAKYMRYRSWVQAKNATRVYSGRWSLPSPSKWGTATSAYWSGIPRIPFSTPWLHRGGHSGLVMDFKFHGGKLANGVNWASGNVPYYLDGVRTDSTQNATVTGQSLGLANSCNDSASGSRYPASTTLTAYVYGDAYSTTSLRGQLSFTTTSFRTAPSASVVQAIAVNGHPHGYSIGAGCQRLYADPTAFLGVFFRKTDTTGRAYGSHKMPFKSSYAGVTIYGQSAWLDSKTGLFSLTKASRLTLPQKPVTVPLRKALWNPSRSGYKPLTVPDASPALQPLPLLVYQ